MTAFDASWASVEQPVQVLALFKQSSVEQEGMAHVSLLFHVEDEVPEVHSCDFLPRVLPGGGCAQPRLAAPAQPHALQENNHSWGLSSPGLPPLHCWMLFKSVTGSLGASFWTHYMRGFFTIIIFSILLNLTELTWVKASSANRWGWTLLTTQDKSILLQSCSL